MSKAFESKGSDGQSLVPVINMLLGEHLVGAEIGVFRAHTFCTLLSCCPSIETLYGIDSYKPYDDCIVIGPYTGKPVYSVNTEQIASIREAALRNIQSLSPTTRDKAVLIEEDSTVALSSFLDDSLDFVFIDTYMTREQAAQDLEQWYPKVKKGGLFSGHDWTGQVIREEVNAFRAKHNIAEKLCTFDNTWMWIK